MAVAYINEEFAKTRDEEKVSSSENDTTTKVSNGERIFSMIQANPNINAEEMAEKLFMTVNGVKYYIKKLKKEERLIRVGSYKERLLES